MKQQQQNDLLLHMDIRGWRPADTADKSCEWLSTEIILGICRTQRNGSESCSILFDRSKIEKTNTSGKGQVWCDHTRASEAREIVTCRLPPAVPGQAGTGRRPDSRR